MFTGIIETLGSVTALVSDGSNLHISIQSPISKELKIDQSIAHNGVCLTVIAVEGDIHTVTAIHETLIKSSLNQLEVGSKVNLERCMQVGARLDGHFVQGHVDQTAVCTHIEESDGSWYYTFKYDNKTDNILVDKGSITVDGTSLTIVKAEANSFSVAIIPYTHEHTVFHTYQIGTVINLEFDVIGKYIIKMFKSYQQIIGRENS